MAEQFRTTSASSHLKNRRIFTGGQSTTWQVPEGTTEVWVHVWGGGGSSCGVAQGCCPQCNCPKTGAAGGGGGYSRAIYSVTDADTLSITVGGNGGTSSVTIPTQTPGSPLSATGGGSASSATSGGSGGTGSITLNPTFPTYYCMTASGGSGGAQRAPGVRGYGGGGAAGSPLGQGGNGMEGLCSCRPQAPCACDFNSWNCRSNDGGSGGGIGGSNGAIDVVGQRSTCGPNCPLIPFSRKLYCTCTFQLTGGSALQTNSQIIPDGTFGTAGAPSAVGAIFGSVGHFDVQMKYCQCLAACSLTTRCPTNPAFFTTELIFGATITTESLPTNTTSGIEWFYVEDIMGSSGFYNPCTDTCTNLSPVGDGAGGAGGVIGANSNAGFLGGGGGRGCDICNSNYNPPSNPGICPFSCGGCAGGAGATCVPVPGTPGAVIIYW